LSLDRVPSSGDTNAVSLMGGNEILLCAIRRQRTCGQGGVGGYRRLWMRRAERPSRPQEPQHYADSSGSDSKRERVSEGTWSMEMCCILLSASPDGGLSSSSSSWEVPPVPRVDRVVGVESTDEERGVRNNFQIGLSSKGVTTTSFFLMFILCTFISASFTSLNCECV
jgi:hypothetical protein